MLRFSLGVRPSLDTGSSVQRLVAGDTECRPGSERQKSAMRDRVSRPGARLVDPWFVDDVELSIEKRRIDISLAHYEPGSALP